MKLICHASACVFFSDKKQGFCLFVWLFCFVFVVVFFLENPFFAVHPRSFLYLMTKWEKSHRF